MNTMLILGRVYVVFIAFSFILGQLFSGTYDPIHTVVGISGIIVGILGARHSASHKARSVAVVALCVIGLVAVGLDSYRYYSKDHALGNYYPWLMVLPYCAFLLLILAVAIGKVSSNKQKQTDA